jgi:hypothetical protein
MMHGPMNIKYYFYMFFDSIYDPILSLILSIGILFYLTTRSRRLIYRRNIKKCFFDETLVPTQKITLSAPLLKMMTKMMLIKYIKVNIKILFTNECTLY